MSAFRIFGIIFNVTLTVLAIYRVLKQMRPRDKRPPDTPARDEQNHNRGN